MGPNSFGPAGVCSGDGVLDIAAGSGNAASFTRNHCKEDK
jgi:ubiquinone/menaquinone biosynthesis C-methylase UbiE